MSERYLNFNNFIKQRALQITKFTQILQLNSTKRTHQSLPKTVRRRAMSHNRYRIPLKLRKPLQNDLIKAQSMQRLPKCRKSIRKKHRLIISYKARSARYSWLNTHLWAAKRMRMCQYSGYKIAQSPNNKSFRSAYRHFRHNACLMDYSYLQCITIKYKRNNNELPQQIIIKNGNKISHYNRFYEGKIYHVSKDNNNSEQNKLICPIIIFPESQFVIRCMFDPFCLQQINKISWDEQKYEIQVSKSKSQIYLLLGPESLSRVQQIFIKLGLQKQINVNQLKLNANKYQFIHINSTIYRDNNKPMITLPIQQTISQFYDVNQNKKMRELFFKSLKSNKKNQNSSQIIEANNNFWQFYNKLAYEMQREGDISQKYIHKITSRSKYTHKRKNKLTKEQKKKILIQQARQMTPSRTKKQQGKQIQQNVIQVRQEQSLKFAKQLQQTIQQNKTQQKLDPLIIAPFADLNSRQSMYQGCFILCSNQDNCKVWRALSQANVKIIGRKEFRHCAFQSRLKFFPNDYAQSQSFSKYNKSRAIDLINIHRKLPSQKRANYQKLYSPFPFYFNLPQNIRNNQLTSVSIQMLSRGKCFTGSYICKLQPEDYQEITNQMDNDCVVKSIALQDKKQDNNKQSIQQSSLNYNTLTYQQIVKQLCIVERKMKRKIIGFITYGGFVHSLCREGGIGYLFQNPPQIQQNKLPYVLIRKPTSRFYFVGIITKI